MNPLPDLDPERVKGNAIKFYIGARLRSRNTQIKV